jgi:PhzF family phenazine biosynthesis protein
MTQPLFIVDAFTDRAFAGNPAAVCLLPTARDARWMQDVAREMNLSETAFVTPRSTTAERGDGFDLRWFTPGAEVDLCGHATLASAHILWCEGHLPASAPAQFHTRSGLLTASRDGAWITLDFPATPPEPAPAPPGLDQAIRVPWLFVGRNQFDYVVEVESEAVVRELAPDLAVLKTIPVRGLIVTSRSADPAFDFVSRFFAPRVGVNEDPVTGSAHCCLGPLWAARLGKRELNGYQASARGGGVRVRLVGDRVHLGGQAVTVVRGQLDAG